MEALRMKEKVVVLTLIIILWGCQSLSDMWREAEAKNTIDGYEKFLLECPRKSFLYQNGIQKTGGPVV
jgi:hypothetical protein